MWRIGHLYAEQKATLKKKRNAVDSEVSKSALSGRGDLLKLGGRKSKTPSMFKGTMLDPKSRDRRGSIIATEYLAKRRSSRVPKNFAPELVFSNVNGHESSRIHNKDDIGMMDSLRPFRRNSRRASVVHRLGKVKEIQDRINKVMTDYEHSPSSKESGEGNLLKELDENLFLIPDDSLRINVSLLMEKYRKLSKYVKEQRDSYPEDKRTDDKTELLESLQKWLDTDHFEDIDEESETEELAPLVEDKEPISISKELEKIKEKMNKLEYVKKKLMNLKTKEERAKHSTRQMSTYRQDTLPQLVQQDGVSNEPEKREFTYIKNAATEIYDLLRTTRIEGMAHAHQFEEQLQKILQEMDLKEKALVSIQQQDHEKKKVIEKLSLEMENLQNELSITRDERNLARSENRSLKQSIKKKEGVIMNEQKQLNEELESKLKSCRQKLEVLAQTLEEKENYIVDANEQISRLKESLKKLSNTASTESLRSLVSEETPSSRESKRRRNVISRNASMADSLILEPEKSSEEQCYVCLRHRNDSSIFRKTESSNAFIQASQPEIGKVIRRGDIKLHNKRVQTDQSTADNISNTVISVQMNATSFHKTEVAEASCQTTDWPTLPHLDASEREDMVKIVQMMEEKMDSDWLDVALKLSTLGKQDILELNKGLACKEEIVRMYAGSPTKTGKEMKDEKSLKVTVSEQLQKLAEEMLSGKSPNYLETKNLDTINTIQTKMKNVTSKMTDFISDIKYITNYQSGIMDNASKVIKDNLPVDVVSQIHAKRLAKEGASSCSEHVHEWRQMSEPDQVKCKMDYIEETMHSLVKETMNIYLGEVSKKHDDYNDIHNMLQAKEVEISELVSNPAVAVKEIASKVEKDTPVEKSKQSSPVPFQQQLKSGRTSQLDAMGEGRSPHDWKQGISPYTKVWYPKSTGSGQLAVTGEKTSEHRDVKLIKTAGPQMHRPGHTERSLIGQSQWPGITDTKKRKTIAGNRQNKGLGLLVQNTGQKIPKNVVGRHMHTSIASNRKLTTDIGIQFSKVLSVNAAYGDRVKTTAPSEKNWNQMNLFDLHSRVNDPKFSGLVRGHGSHTTYNPRNASFGIEHARSMPVSTRKKRLLPAIDDLSPTINHLIFLTPKANNPLQKFIS